MNQNRAEDRPSQSQFPDLPLAITSFGAARLADSLYVYGGHHGQAHHYSRLGQSGDLLRLSLGVPSAWETVSNGPRLQGLALVAHQQNLYRIGGFTARNEEDQEQDLWSLADCARFDPAEGQWQDLPAMPSPRSSFDAVVAGDALYVVGGWSMQGNREADWLETACMLDLARTPLEWKQLATPPFQRRALAVGALGEKIYAIGGMLPDGKVTRRTAVYDPIEDSWSEGPELPGEEMDGFGTACCTLAGHLYVSTASGSVLRLSDHADSWRPAGKLANGRFFHQMLPVDDHHVAIIGGANMQQGRFMGVEMLRIDPTA